MRIEPLRGINTAVDSTKRGSLTRQEGGSTLILIPSLLLIALSIIALGIDAVSLLLAKEQLNNVSSACAIDGARAISLSTFYGSGARSVDRTAADHTVTSCLEMASLDPSISLGTTQVTTSTSYLTVALRAGVRLPLDLFFLPNLKQVTVTSSAIANEVQVSN